MGTARARQPVVNAEQRGPLRQAQSGHAGPADRAGRRGTPAAILRSARETAAATTVKPVVVKLGGRALEAPGALKEFAAALARLSRVTLLVHGGGAEVTSWCTRLGIQARFDQGLRVTDAPTLEVATAVLAGLANKRLVAALRALGVDAVGLAALDGGIVEAAPHARAAALGAVGEVARVDAALLDTLLAQGRTPVVASIACDAAGELLNLNADDAAAALAAAVHATDLVLLSDTPGLRLDGAVVPALALAELDATLARPDVGGGMVPKLLAAGAAVRGGVGRVHIAAWEGPDTLAALLERGTLGTTLAADAATREDAHA
jgi:acetylglutamate kinase